MSESYPYLDDGEYELGFGAGKFMAKTKLFFLLNANSTTRMKAYPYAAHHIHLKNVTCFHIFKDRFQLTGDQEHKTITII